MKIGIAISHKKYKQRNLLEFAERIGVDIVQMEMKTLGLFDFDLSYHLPTPKIGPHFKIKNENKILTFCRDLSSETRVTIHPPNILQKDFNALGEEKRKKILSNMTDFYAKLADMNLIIGIENNPVKANGKYGSTPGQLIELVELIKDKTDNKDNIGVAFDVNHAIYGLHDIDEKLYVFDDYATKMYDYINMIHIEGLQEKAQKNELETMMFTHIGEKFIDKDIPIIIENKKLSLSEMTESYKNLKEVMKTQKNYGSKGGCAKRL